MQDVTQEQNDVFEKVANIISTKTKVKKEEITLDSDFELDLKLDSLDIVEIVMAIEEEFDITIPDEDVQKLRTVKAAVEYIRNKIS
ncbi:MAG: acyl carrier protein [Minisyncoccia bacterium]